MEQHAGHHGREPSIIKKEYGAAGLGLDGPLCIPITTQCKAAESIRANKMKSRIFVKNLKNNHHQDIMKYLTSQHGNGVANIYPNTIVDAISRASTFLGCIS